MVRFNSPQVKYLSAAEILVIHSEILDQTGGLHGLRDTGLLASIIERPKTSFGGNEIFKNVFEKAATYFESLAKYHVFLDGNKRTAIGASARFLYVNNFEFIASNEEVEKFVLEIITEKLEINPVRSSRGALNPVFAKIKPHSSPQQATGRSASNGVKEIAAWLKKHSRKY